MLDAFCSRHFVREMHTVQAVSRVLLSKIVIAKTLYRAFVIRYLLESIIGYPEAVGLAAFQLYGMD